MEYFTSTFSTFFLLFATFSGTSVKLHNAKVKETEDVLSDFLKQCPFKPGGSKYKVY